MAKNQALSLRAQWLGERLKDARNRAGYTLRDVADYLKMKHGTISRFENGIYRIRPSYVRDLIDFYGISDAKERATLLQLNDDAWQKDIWDGNVGQLDSEFMDYSWLESRATRISVYDPLIINGLLQTPEYAEAMTRTGLGTAATSQAIAQTIEVRKIRQRILDQPQPTRLTVVFEEVALQRSIGGTSTYLDQLKHLITSASSDHIDIRVLDARRGWHPGLHGPFTLINLPDPYPNVAYIENLIGRVFLEDETKVRTYQHAYDDLKQAARTPSESKDFLRSLLKEST